MEKLSKGVNVEGYLVKDWMTIHPITITGDATVPEAYWLMVNNKIRRLLVVDNEDLVGIVTLEDLRQKIPVTAFAIDAVRLSDFLTSYPIRQIMSQNPKTTSPETPLVVAAKEMLTNKISTLPVMDGNKVVGIITEGDIFRAFVELVELK